MSHRCPTCGDEFSTRRGLGVHHAKDHDERLPNRECEECGAGFYCESDRMYCSEECLSEGRSLAGTDNPNYQGKKRTGTCSTCGDQFEYYPLEKPGIYCSECVDEAPWRDPPSRTGASNPQWSGGKRSITCTVCGDLFDRYPSNIQSEVTLCSEPCRHRWLSMEFSGEGHPNWDGGGVDDYGSGWNRVRSLALERDNYECVICGTSTEALGRNPDVHHIVPVRSFREADRLDVSDAHYLDNVVTLCPGCHRRAEFDKLPKRRLKAAIYDRE